MTASTGQERAGRYTKKPVTIEAVQYGRRFDWPDWFHDAVSANKIVVHGTGKHADPRAECFATIYTLEGVMTASEGDWIIQGVKGELYPCKPDVFSATYESEQAARRAQVVAVPQGLREAAQRAHDWMERQQRQQSKGGHATFDMMMLREERDALAEALAVAPQPPEATVKDSLTVEAAPVQMPEPLARIEGGSLKWRIPDSRYSLPVRYLQGTHNLYTENQVRQLLADHGIQEQST